MSKAFYINGNDISMKKPEMTPELQALADELASGRPIGGFAVTAVLIEQIQDHYSKLRIWKHENSWKYKIKKLINRVIKR